MLSTDDAKIALRQFEIVRRGFKQRPDNVATGIEDRFLQRLARDAGEERHRPRDQERAVDSAWLGTMHWLATTFTEHKDGFDARGLETGFGVSLLMERAKHSLDSRAKPGGIHAYRYHWRRIGWRDARASLAESWRGRDLGSTQSRRSETSVATQGARQSASRSGQGGGNRGDRNALVRGRSGNQQPGQPQR
jgi:hypothetical protein